MPNVLIIGCGKIGTAVGRVLNQQGHPVVGTARSPESLQRIAEAGFTPKALDLDRETPLKGLPTQGVQLFYFAPPPGGGDIDSRMRHVLANLLQTGLPSRIVYISTSGVYGDCQGEVVDETRTPNPQTARGKRRWDAEKALQIFAREHSVDVIILRVTGIYGPGRLPIQRVRDRQPVLRVDEARYTNRIHTSDLVSVCLAAMKKGKPGQVYNVCDGQESTMTDYFNAIADAYGIPRPPQVSLEEARKVMSPLMLTYVQESRRLSNRKMLEELGVSLLYPTLAEGIRSCIETPAR